ncbi:MAG TPA: hypothetical protein VMS93_00745 [Candidatus Saccharimonadales bacterium]|nr:hypothetical protein [Candidatus Saccharimonadales bacterium]
MNRERFGAGWAAALAVTFLLTAPAQAIVDNTTQIDVNSISSYVTNHNSYAYNLPFQTAGFEWPRGSSKTAVYAAGLWIGARLAPGAPPIVKVGEYSQQWGPGPMLGRSGQADQPGFKVYKVRRGDTPATNPDYAAWPVTQGAPVDSLGNPLILGDMTLWSVCNDRTPKPPVNRAGTAGTDSARSLGLELQQTTFAYSRLGALNNVLFVKYKIINKGGSYLYDTYVSLWADPDLGDANDDLVGCDTTLSVGFVYNSSNNDGVYGVAPPSVGWDFFQGPLDKRTGKRLPMTSFNKYINGTDPQSPQESYNYMRGLKPDGSVLIDPTTNQPTTFDVSGDPVKGTGTLDTDPADRRLMLSAGPFDMAPGDTQEVVAGVIVGRGSDNLASVNVMKLLDKEAQAAYDANFDLATPPPAPKVVVRALNNAIDLSWDAGAVNDHQHKVFYIKRRTSGSTGQDTTVVDTLIDDYYFQGFNVYQAPKPSGPWTKLATFDLGGENDTVLTIYADEPDPVTFATQRVLVQNGTNSGLQFRYHTETDRVNGGRIVNNKPYFFAVTAYNYEADHAVPYFDATTGTKVGIVTESLENDQLSEALTIVPASRTLAYHFPADHKTGTSATLVNVAIINPDSATGHTYQVRTVNRHLMDDGLPGTRLAWLLKDLNTGVESDTQANLTGVLSNLEPPGNFKALVTGLDWQGPFGGPYINGSLDYADDFFGTTLARGDLVPIELRFDPANGQFGYAYRRHSGEDDNYAYEGFGTVPFKAYDVSDPAHPRQINVAFVQNYGDTTDNSPPRWLPDASDVGGREYLFILKSSYSTTPLGQYTSDVIANGDVDMMYAFAAARSSNLVGPSPGDLLYINVSGQDTARAISGADYVAKTGDTYEFLFPRPGQMIGSEVNNDLTKIRVVPNPYYTHSIYETNQFGRRVKFTHLPNVKVTIRIFNLAGDLVRTLVRTDVSQAEIYWDLLNESQLPVASGVYVFHVDAPGVGSTVGKLAVFLEREKINNF